MLRAERERAGLTQASLANAADLSQSYVALMEGGSKPPPNDGLIIAIATALRCDPDILFAAADRTPPDLVVPLADRLRSIKRMRSKLGRNDVHS